MDETRWYCAIISTFLNCISEIENLSTLLRLFCCLRHGDRNINKKIFKKINKDLNRLEIKLLIIIFNQAPLRVAN